MLNIESTAELVVFPSAVLHTMVYSLAQAGVSFPDALHRAAIRPGTAAQPYFTAGGPCLITVDGLPQLGWTQPHDTYESFSTIYQAEWLVALLPLGGTRDLVTI